MGSGDSNNCVWCRRTSFSLCLIILAALCSSGATVDQEIQDFDFEDADSESHIVKRAAVLSDDEDLMLGDPTSTPLFTDEGSGTTEQTIVKTDSITLTGTARPIVIGYPRYIRVVLNFTSIPFNTALENRSSREFKELSRIIQKDLENLFRSLLKQDSIKILQFNRGSTQATVDIALDGEVSMEEIRSALEDAIAKGFIGVHRVSSEGFSFQPIVGTTAVPPCNTSEFFCSANKVCINKTLACDAKKDCPDGEDEKSCSEAYCPSHVGRNPDKLPRRGDNWANLLINNAFPCDGNVIGWEYYRLVPQGSAFVGIWRQESSEAQFNLISKTELPSAPVGVREVEVDPIPVRKGDFIGIFYPSSTPTNVIAQAQLADDILTSNELYQNFHIEIFDEDIQTNNNLIDLEEQKYDTINATFSLRAVMDYEVGPTVVVVTGLQCTPDQFNCGDICIDLDLYCDGQEDCNDGSDEKGCKDEVCIEGRSRCKDGTCIPRLQWCDGIEHCPDGSDENCQVCTDGMFQCNSGHCIPDAAKCNGNPDCLDFSDENPILCNPTFPTVPPPCPTGFQRCNDGTCLESCTDLAQTCAFDQFTCVGGGCISRELRCDGEDHCDDGSDETDCGLYITGPGEALVGDRVKLICNVTGGFQHSHFIHWYKDDSINISALAEGASNRMQIRNYDHRNEGFLVSELHFLEAEIADSGVYTCAVARQVSAGYTLIVARQVFICEPDHFKCRREHQCVHQMRICDGRHDCRDKSDEFECSCRIGQFQCASGGCIDQRRRCDMRPDCSDRSDEAGCTERELCTGSDMFRCKNGQCIKFVFLCDDVRHCRDGSDEENCDGCGSDQFKCTNGQCIEADRQCDGMDDCVDGIDEIDCDGCRKGQFECRDRSKCISDSALCNRIRDCDDYSDEMNCVCTASDYKCTNGQCIPSEARCDRIRDCQDGSDELLCPKCSRGQFECRNGRCVSDSAVCNRVRDCEDYSDEFNCECTDSEFPCLNHGQCIPLEAQCNRRRECFDGSDEQDCPICQRNEFMCADESCIEGYLRCNGAQDCIDYSDEFNCNCTAGQFRCENGQCVPGAARCNRRPDCFDQSDERGCVVACRFDQFTCANSECIDRELTCDGNNDCGDDSDEQNCVGCKKNEFECDDGRCISNTAKCNRVRDCADYSDEINCDCNSSEYRCANGQCIPKGGECDRRPDCFDESDESNCARCRRNQFECNDGNCIDSRNRCDRAQHCEDFSDEFNCTCNRNEHRCDNGQCVSSAARCNGREECYDKSDESGCVRACREDQFRCDNRNCFEIWQKCDGRRDCQDGTDERNCPFKCMPGQFRCTVGGQCVDAGFRCDGRVDCSDRSDEQNCPICSGMFRCDSRRCLNMSQVCNGRRECNDNTDEMNCAPPTCTPEQFTCLNGQCIDNSRRCNRVNDCEDGSDESNCPCRSGEFTCDGVCFSQSRKCNGEEDCSDGSDERGCAATVYVSPEKLIKRYGTSASFTCNVLGNTQARITWIRRTGGAMPTQAAFTGNRLLIPDLRIEDSGDYTCVAVGTFGRVEAYARLEVEFVGPPIVPTGGPCDSEQVPCADGKCIYKGYFCDGENDCRDGSDERNCPTLQLPCEPNEFRCDTGKCAMKIWRCDGDNDCGDSSDEVGCDVVEPGSPCKAFEFQCASRDQCIPSGYQCDEDIDCIDRSDEIGCSKPTITTPPVPEITVEVNGTFTIICKAIGVPTPLIVWRLNWGNIPTGPRVTVTSVNGVGNLTISNARPEDAGAYTCEAINNRGSIFAIPDANIIVRRTVGVCRESTFNSEALVPSQCVKCFCFGQTQTCFSSSLQISEITMGSQVKLVRRQNMQPAEPGFIQYIPTSRMFEVKDFNTILRSGSYYWSLPPQFLAKKLSSYGGKLSYQVYYEVDGFENPTDEADIILIGNNITLYHKSENYERVDRKFRPRGQTTVTVPLNESAWEIEQRSPRDGPISGYATREDLMTVLENVTHILIRASYDSRQSLIRLGNVVLTTGVPYNTGLGRAVYVEDCRCPPGYAGSSCEECAPGFYRVQDGRFNRRCVACRCNQHSNECDPFSGICRNCRDNTAGPYCGECAPGYYGDPRTGACQACPCPLTSAQNQFGRSCFVSEDREVTCNCPPGYVGRRCERCASGYVGNPMVLGDRCRRRSDDVCDTRGSISSVPDSVTGLCRCKGSVTGPLCDTCGPDTFYLSDANPQGCISCFCMGVTQTCQSSTWNRVPITLSFSQSASDVILTDLSQSEKIREGFIVSRQTRELVFRDFDNYNRKILYWSLPQQFLGNKITAYGGMLRFTLRYKAGRDSTPVDLLEPLVLIRGNELEYEYRAKSEIMEDKSESFAVPFIESEWNNMDGNRATREHWLMALANLQHILIRATFTTDTEESAISGISLDVAEDRVTDRERAYQVEQCACPRGYKGLSCEECGSGYTRTRSGLYLGLCEECRCNRHSTECDPETGVCKNCRHNTEGPKCDRCARGYYGNATRGSVNDCQRCPCPLTESPNQFSSDCVLNRDGQVTCTACPAGHTGRRCESCAPGYTGNPNRLGDYCKKINETCGCDPRGTVPNTQCDSATRQCQCKNNVQGINCNACRPGYFNLNRDLDTGCLKCFCSGVSTDCTSSNYYRSEIIPMLEEDGPHNFALVNPRLSRMVRDGFNVDAGRDEITFDNFEGIQQERDSLYFSLPPKFRGDKVSSYGGFLSFTLQYTASVSNGKEISDLDVLLIGKRNQKLHHVFRQSVKARQSVRYKIQLVESSFQDSQDLQTPSRETFLTVLADLSAILIRATYHQSMDSVTLGDLRMDTAVPSPGRVLTPEVERCRCPEGYAGLSCQQCAPGFLRVVDLRTALGRCTRCNCNGHSTSCDAETGACQNCQHNTEGDRCERCRQGYYGDPSSGTPNDCRPCACPLTLPSNNFSPTCYLENADNRVTCTRCPTGYTGRDCGQCAVGYRGNPRQPGGQCSKTVEIEVVVNPSTVREPLGSTVVFQCLIRGRPPFEANWSRSDRKMLPRKAVRGPSNELTITDIDYSDAAKYVCTVTSPDGASSSGEGILIVERPELPIKIKIAQPTELFLKQGEQAMFTCSAIQFNNAANYVLTWRKEGGQLPSKATDADGILIIPNINQNDAGSYTCTGSQRGSIDMATARIILDVTESPNVVIEPSTTVVEEGARVVLLCKATGIPRPTIKWTIGTDMKPLPLHVITDNEGRLIIESVVPSDRSSYFCTASNSAGTAQSRAIINISSSRVVRVFIRRANITGVVGQSEQIVCESDGADVTLVWSRSGGLPPGVTQADGVLSFTNLQQSYAGTYICTGTVPTGRVVGRERSFLTVISKPYTKPTARIEPDQVTLGPGTTAVLRCVVTGEPLPTITWGKVRGQLSDNHQVRENIFRILQASPEDRGRYTCTATNAAGSVQATAMVNYEVREPPLVELLPSVSQVRQTGESASFECRILQGTPTPSVTWSRGGGLPLTSRTEVRENGVLLFTDLTAEEQGEYICTSENVAGSVSATASLKVQGKPSIHIKPGTTITTYVGYKLNIECVGIGDPTPTVYWKSGQKRRSDVLPETSGEGLAKLAFESIRKSDAGSYICVASNVKGTSEKNVDVIVNDRDFNEIGVSIEGPEQFSVNSGQSVELTCLPKGLPNPVVTWGRANRLALPPGHSVRDGVLYIPRITEQNAGEYVCTLTTEQESKSYKASVFIIVNVPPRLKISPSTVKLASGGSLQLVCQPTGQGPFTIEWTKLDGTMSSSASQSNDGILYIQSVTRADSGRYKCTAKNDAGSSDAYSDVDVLVPPIIERIDGQASYAYQSTIALTCVAQGTPEPSIRWERTSGGAMPLQYQIRDNSLIIFNADPADSGIYTCIAANEIGYNTQEFPVTVNELNGYKDLTHTFEEGQTIELECVNEETPDTQFTWSKLEGQIPRHIQVNSRTLFIASSRVSDSGTYRCTVTELGGSTKVDILVAVQPSQPVVPTEYRTTAALGSPAQLRCDSVGLPQIGVTWVKENGELPSEHTVNLDGSLYIPRVREGDGGRYNCQAPSQVGRKVYPVYLFVGALVPYFGHGSENSYLEYLPLQDAYQELDILLSFRPETQNGLLLYNGQYQTESGDFVCFGLKNQRPEFRFDVGSGPAIITGNRSLELNKWHTVHLKRNKRNGTLLVNDEFAYHGYAPGQHEGLELGAPLYLGSVPNFKKIPRLAGFSEGLVGSVSQVQVKGVNMNLGLDAIKMNNVLEYAVCQKEATCLNGATCRPMNIRSGYVCDCAPGFMGERCEERGACSPGWDLFPGLRRVSLSLPSSVGYLTLVGANEMCGGHTIHSYLFATETGLCGIQGRCVEHHNFDYSCICPAPYTDIGCSGTLQISDPAFNKNSFIAYSKISDGLNTVRISIDFLPRLLEDGIILYNAQRNDGKQDFIALVIKNRHLEFRFDVGSGPAIIRSRQPLRANEWTKVIADRKGREGMLIVNNEESVNEQVPASNGQVYPRLDRGDVIRGSTAGNKTVGLNLDRPLYLGGVDPAEIVSNGAGVSTGFVGCVGELVINETPIKLIEDAKESLNVKECGERKLCSRQPCKNNGLCEDVSPTEYYCRCESGYTGRNCEIRIDFCLLNSPCRNGGLCVSLENNQYQCNCPLRWAGDNCQDAVTLGSRAQFNGGAYLEIESSKFARIRRTFGENLTMTIETKEPEGLIIWQGQKPGEHRRTKADFYAIAIVDGFVEFSYDLGSGPLKVKSLRVVNDGYKHTVTVIRDGLRAKLMVDRDPVVTGLSPGSLSALNVMGNLFVGGVPDMKHYTDMTYTTNFRGCVSDLRLSGQAKLIFDVEAKKALNVVPCY